MKGFVLILLFIALAACVSTPPTGIEVLKDISTVPDPSPRDEALSNLSYLSKGFILLSLLLLGLSFFTIRVSLLHSLVAVIASIGVNVLQAIVLAYFNFAVHIIFWGSLIVLLYFILSPIIKPHVSDRKCRLDLWQYNKINGHS